MVHFVGAGPGAKDLITIRGKKFIEDADMIIYAGSLINPELLEEAKPGCILYDSAKMTLEEVAEKLVWYVVDAGKEAFLYYGFRREISKEEFARRIEEDTLLEVLNAVPVHKGDVLFIESGTIHAIGKDILIAEIQQNSNVTYRVYDYGRVGKDGKKRDLHIEKALAVTNRVPIIRDNSSYPHVADCDYFTVDKLNLDGTVMRRMEGTVTENSFVSILFLDGEGEIACKGERLKYQKGDSFFLAAGSGAYEIVGQCDALVTTV